MLVFLNEHAFHSTWAVRQSIPAESPTRMQLVCRAQESLTGQEEGSSSSLQHVVDEQGALVSLHDSRISWGPDWGLLLLRVVEGYH